jgi:hypothetical protein
MEGTVNSIYPPKKKNSRMEGKVNSIYRQKKKNIYFQNGRHSEFNLSGNKYFQNRRRGEFNLSAKNISRMEAAVNSIYVQKIFPKWKAR